MKRIAVLGGGDWNDASVNLLMVPEHINMSAEKDKWRHWYVYEYTPAHKQGLNPKYLSLRDWLIEKCGATTNTDIEEVWEF